MQSKILWQPQKILAQQSQMFDFMQRINKKFGCNFQEYHDLHKWTVDHIPEFWGEFWEYADIIHSTGFKQVVDDPAKMPGAKWFAEARLNFAENLLQRRDDYTAIIFWGENKVRRSLSYAELFDQVRLIAAGLKRLGVKKGDRVAGFIPNMPEAIIAMLAAASIGAIWSSNSPDLGIKGVLDRFSQIEPKIIFAADGYYFRGKILNTQEKLAGIIDKLPSIEHVIVISYTGTAAISTLPKCLSWEDLAQATEEPLGFEQLPFDHPLYILYSSGTTGLPKSIVHSAGGTLIQHLKELRLHCNLTPADTIFYYTTCGWMMWNWLVSSLAVGATFVCYDGNPFYPTSDALLKMADDLGVTIFGTSAKYIATLEDIEVIPNQISSYPALKLITSTGSTLADESFDYVYEKWKRDVQLSSISGGSDIISCFVLGSPTLPVYRGEIQCKGLGMDVDCFDESGHPLIDRQGELVCKSAFPSMPIYFWNDPDGKKYHDAYFETFPGIWHHGDYIRISRQGGIAILGRSDATLNPSGVRIGTAEIYPVVESLEEISDSVAVGQQYEGDERIILFVKLAANQALTEELKRKINQQIRGDCSPRHVPAVILETADIPYTLSGEKVEMAVKKIIHGQEVKNMDALANPDSLDNFKNRQELL
ncbi:MAG: acetoacetate--CoA ligase [Deltaproteobacteria bacterium]|nr:acetoacetate--CoA ligase [Deltaproteobacteria bacterium]